MKFLTKINRNYFLLLTLILLGVSIAGYFILQAIVLDDTKENLLEKEYLIKKQILETGEVPNIYPIIEVKKIDHKTIEKPFFKEIFIKNELEDELEPFLEYSNQIKIKDSYYSINLRQSSFESEDLVIILALSLFILLLSAFGISFFITKKMNKTIWADFEHNLQEIEKFSFSENINLYLLNSDIEEFDRLNKVINNLTEKLKTDYLSLKEFTENASHEIQTPLSIVLLNLEEVLQQKLNAESFGKVVAAINAIKRLSLLNQNLLLLTKIENNQFIASDFIVFNELMQRKIDEFELLFKERNIKVNFISHSGFQVKMNLQLAEILINNLLSNAVNHNVKNGYVNINADQNEITICNTGLAKVLDNETIFNRFVKGNSASYGLGLAIVKQICDTHHLQIHYTNNELHCFTIIHVK